MLAAVLLFVAGCGGGSGGDSATTEAGLRDTPRGKLAQQPAASCAALKDYVAESLTTLYTNGGGLPCADCLVTLAGFPPAAAARTEETTADYFTGTNNQEAGVDELDRIEVDRAGRFYVLDGRHLVVAQGSPASALAEIGHLELTDAGDPVGLTLDEDNSRLVIAVNRIAPSPVARSGFIAPGHLYEPVTELLFVDVSEPSDPVLSGRLAVEGHHLALRRVGGRVHLVTHFNPAMPASIREDAPLQALHEQYLAAPAGTAAATALAEDIEARIVGLLADVPVGDFLPERWQASADEPYEAAAAGDCTGVALPDVPMRFALTSVTSVDTDGGENATLSLTNNAWQVYASSDHVYLTQTSGGWWWDERQRQQTVLYRIAIGEGAPVFRSHGMVDGWAESAFQLSEHEGFLRVATSRNEFDPAADAWVQDNHLHVLEDDGAGNLVTVGAVTGYAPGERIFSARFMGDRGFVVTFRQIDPLFAFDLSDPRDPRLLGEVEIPGVSTYLHPIDESHLLTIGINGDDTGLDWQMRLQIFDVQDLTRPRLLHALVPDFGAGTYAWSLAVYDHLAFNYFPAAGLLTIPVQYWGESPDSHFSGFASFGVSTQDGLTDLGRMDHGDLARAAYCPDPATAGLTIACDEGHYLESATPRRAVGGVIDGEQYVFTVSDVGIKVARVERVDEAVAVLPLEYPNIYWWWF